MDAITYRFLIGDTETTGFPPGAKVCEFALIEIDADLNVLKTWETLVNPGIPIPDKISLIHGIYDSDVADASSIEHIFEHDMPRFENVILIAHNVKFDRPFFAPFMGIVGELCTLELARKHLPHAPNHRLGTLRAHLDLKVEAGHEAMGDILVVLDLLRHLVPMTGRSLPQMVGASVKPSMLYVMPFGEHKGKPISELPASYREWMLRQDISADLRLTLETLRTMQ